MEIRYLLGDVELNEKEKEYVEKKILKTKKLLKKYSDKELFAEVEIRVDKKGFWTAEFMVETPHELFRADKTSNDLMMAADMAEEALMKQIRRNNEKIKDTTRNRDKRGRLGV